MNNKNEESYYKVFQSFKNIITLEGSKELELISYSTDYEIALSNALERLFPKINHYGCYFHYSFNIGKNIKSKIISKIKKKKFNEYINELDNIKNLKRDLLAIPFIIENNKNIVEEILKKYNDNIYKEFKNYFYNQWNIYIKKNILNYNMANKEERSNSFIENYNKRIKIILSK